MKIPLNHQHRRRDDPLDEIVQLEPPPATEKFRGMVPTERTVIYSIAPARYVTIKGAAAAMGLTESSVRKRLERGIWLENSHWRRAPDGRIYVDMKAVEAWIETDSPPRRQRGRPPTSARAA